MTMTPLLRPMAVFAFFGLFSAPMAHAQHTAMPAGMSHDEHMAQRKKEAEMKQHGNLAVGFDPRVPDVPDQGTCDGRSGLTAERPGAHARSRRADGRDTRHPRAPG